MVFVTEPGLPAGDRDDLADDVAASSHWGDCQFGGRSRAENVRNSFGRSLPYVIRRCEEELQKRLVGILRLRAQSTRLAALHARRGELWARADRIADAITLARHSPTLLCRLRYDRSRSATADERNCCAQAL